MTAFDSFFQLSKQAFGPFVGPEDGAKVGSWYIDGAVDGSIVSGVSDGALVGGRSVIGQSSASNGVHVEPAAFITKIAVH